MVAAAAGRSSVIGRCGGPRGRIKLGIATTKAVVAAGVQMTVVTAGILTTVMAAVIVDPSKTAGATNSSQEIGQSFTVGRPATAAAAVITRFLLL